MRNRYLVIAFATLSPLYAGSFSYTVVTTGQPTFNRPIANPVGGTPIGLSLLGTAVAYSAQTFSIDQAGTYTFNSLSTTPVNWDNYTLLYRTTFNPLNPLLNAIDGNDDLGFIGRSGFSSVLTIGTYVLVTTGYTNTDAGTASNSLTGPGNITATPEAGTMAMFGLGLILLGMKKFGKPMSI